jgi:hypothetical protein
MGNGLFASYTSAARIFNVGFWAGPTPNIAVQATRPSYYTTLKTDLGSMRYGGPGGC